MTKENALKKVHRDLQDKSREFTLNLHSWNEQIDSIDIDMNIHSQTLILKSIFHTNASAIYLSSVINLFRTLSSSTSEDPLYYSAYSHALTLYYLKILAKAGAVEIVEYEKDHGTVNLEDYYSALGNSRRKDVTMYDILFLKKRDLNEDDIEMIHNLMKKFHIDPSCMFLSLENSVIHARLSKREILKSIGSGHSIKKVKTIIGLFTEDKTLNVDFDDKAMTLKQKKKN